MSLSCTKKMSMSIHIYIYVCVCVCVYVCVCDLKYLDKKTHFDKF